VSLKGFPAPPRLHPFERALLDCTVGEERCVGVLQCTRRRLDVAGGAPLSDHHTTASRAPGSTGWAPTWAVIG
jgi:hypothetical protein